MAETQHKALRVFEADGIPFVTCSCRDDGHSPQSAVWIAEHFEGTVADALAEIRSVVARQREEASHG